MNGFLTEPIILSGEQSVAFFNSLRRPNKEYLNRRDEIFSKMDEEISIQRNGMDMEVEIPDLDLSFIDEINSTKERELISNIKMSAEFSFEVDNTSIARQIFKRIAKEKLEIINDIVFDSFNDFNGIRHEQYVYNELGVDKQEAYVKDKNHGNIMKTCKTEQISFAA